MPFRLDLSPIGAVARRKLQHDGLLPDPELSKQYNPAVRKLERIVVSVRYVLADLPETRKPRANTAEAHIREQRRKRMLACGIFAESKLGARQQANGYSRFTDC